VMMYGLGDQMNHIALPGIYGIRRAGRFDGGDREVDASVTAVEHNEDMTKLVRQAQAGDRPALDALFRLHETFAVRLAFLVTGDVELAKDAAQEAFLRTYRQIRSLRDPSAFRTWFARQARRRVAVPLDEATECAVRSCRSPNPGMPITWVNTAVHARRRAATGDRHGTVVECAPTARRGPVVRPAGAWVLVSPPGSRRPDHGLRRPAKGPFLVPPRRRRPPTRRRSKMARRIVACCRASCVRVLSPAPVPLPSRPSGLTFTVQHTIIRSRASRPRHPGTGQGGSVPCALGVASP
jgi:hypothetical protein